MTSSEDGQPAHQRPASPPLPAPTQSQTANGDSQIASSSAHDNFTADAENSATTQPPPPETPPPQRSQSSAAADQVNPVTPANGHDIQMTDAQALGAAMSQSNGFPNAPMDIFGQHPVANYNLMMALAMSANQASPLPTVTPSQVSLPNNMNDGGDPLAVGNGLHPAAAAAAAAGQNLESFARIEFADSTFQMTTYAVIIGRDQRALEQARVDEKRAEQHQRHIEENAALGLPPPSPPQDYRGKFSKSYVSEEGGMLGPESDGEDNPRPAKRRKTNSGGSNSNKAEQQPLPVVEEQNAQGNKKDLISDRQYVSHTPGAAAVDLASLRPSPYHVPFIGIHSPGPNIAANTKAISREHLKIQFNQEKGVFEAIPLHRNGFFHEEVHHREEKVVLRSGAHLQIKDVEFTFIINGVPEGKTGAEQYFDEEESTSKKCYSEGGKEMSFEFESSHGGELRDTSEDESEKEDAENEGSDDEGEEDEEEEGNEDEDDEEVLETVESDQDVKPEPEPEPLPLQLPMPPKKRGPGRPPKNGIMSKREERLLKKQALEAAKKKLPQPPPGEPPIKRKVGRPRKHPLPEDQPDKPEKRKYKPRKPKNEDGAEGSDAEKAPKEKRREKPKTPPLELKMEDFTEEQLQKPNKNYGVLIDEVLSDAPPEGLTLKQIYKRIQKRYPYYFFVVDTKGWESSVRHNLIGNDAFKKNEETHLWCRVPGIELDAGKKRKAASPDQTAASMYSYPPQYQHQMGHQSLPQGNVGMAAQGYPPGTIPPQRFPPNGQAYAGHQGSPPYGAQAPAPGAHIPGRPGYPMPAQAPTPAQLPGYGTPGAPRPQVGAQPTSYNSPYATKAPPQTAGPLQSANAPANAPPLAAQASGVPVQAGQPQNIHHGLQQTHPGAVPPQSQPARSSQPPAPNGSGAPLRPAVDASVVSFIKKFSTQVVAQLDKRTPRAEAIAMSVVNRGLGLAQDSIVPEHDAFEKVILGVFETYKTSYPKQLSQETTDPAVLARAASGQFLDPQLVLVIMRFKASMLEIIKSKLGAQKSEVLILSAIDRVLGFTEKTVTYTESEAERKEFADAENILIPALKAKIDEYLRSQPPPSR